MRQKFPHSDSPYLDYILSTIMTVETAKISLGFFARENEKVVHSTTEKIKLFLDKLRSETIYSSTWSRIFLSRDDLNFAASFSFRAVSFRT